MTLADQPLVDAEVLKRLVAAFDGERRIVASAYNNTMGVPAVFARGHLDDLHAPHRGCGSRGLAAEPVE